MENKKRPAFPLSGEKHQAEIGHGIAPEYYAGLTKKEYFIGMVLQSVIAGYPDEYKANGKFIPSDDYSRLVRQAIEIVDELFK